MTHRLEELLQALERIDTQIMVLLQQRCTLSRKVHAIKERQEGSTAIPDRGPEILSRLTRSNPGPLSDQMVVSLFSHILSCTEGGRDSEQN